LQPASIPDGLSAGRRRYIAYGRVIETSSPMPELEAAEEGREANWYVHFASPSPLPPADPDTWPFAFIEDDNAWLRYRWTARACVLLFPERAWFEVSPGDGVIHAFPAPELDASAIRYLLLDHVLPLAISLALQPVLHASAVVTPWGAIGFVGRSGQGKSTLAASLARSGWPLLADDALVLERTGQAFRAVPSYPNVRLWTSSVGVVTGSTNEAFGSSDESDHDAKRRFGRTHGIEFHASAAPLVALFVLERTGGPGELMPAVRDVGMADAAIFMLSHAFRLEAPARAAADFEWQTDVVRAVRVRRLCLPEDLGALPRARTALERWLERHAMPR
jgi:hypothetical protein